MTSWRQVLFPLLLCCFGGPTFPQGSLTPPAAPAPTFKTLTEIEPRRIVNPTNTPGDAQNTHIISQPGSYYLSGNITGDAGKHGISIQASDVTLDLNGFALVSGGGAGLRGVDVPAARKNLCVRNGVIKSWSGGGIRAENCSNTAAEKLRLTGNVGAVGISVGLGSFIQSCVANGNGTGFQTVDRCHLEHCISTENTSHGFDVTDYVNILDCTSSRNQGTGFKTGAKCSIQRCSATRNDISGIVAGDACTISDCTAGSNLGKGISAVAGLVSNCNAAANSETGMLVSGGRVNSCSANSNGLNGIDASGSSTTNSVARLNGDNGIIVAGGVLAFSLASLNNQNNVGAVDIIANGTTRTGNNPAP